MTITQTEPVAVGGTIVSVAVALIGALQGFGVTHLSSDQVSLILSLLSGVVVAVTAFARSRVTPVAAPKAVVALDAPAPPA